MMRSLFSGVSGLRVHQTKMDVIANNIANVNTVGFKSGRVVFSEVFYQRISGASSANDATGRAGTNPMQIGLGAGVASIDNLMTQGTAQRTDNPTDVMIQGNGFFIVSDGSGTYFTRAGNISQDAQHNLHINGLKLMGWDTVWDEKTAQYVVQTGPVQPITITGDKEFMNPNPTTIVDLIGNLNALEEPVCTRTMNIFDSVGNSYTIDVVFTYHPEEDPNDPDAPQPPSDANNSYWDFKFVKDDITGSVLAYPKNDRKNPQLLDISVLGLTDEDSKTTDINSAGEGLLCFSPKQGLLKGYGAYDDAYTVDDLIQLSQLNPNEAPQIRLLITPSKVLDPTAHFGSDIYYGDYTDFDDPDKVLGNSTDTTVTNDPGTFLTGVVRVDFSSLRQQQGEKASARFESVDGNTPGSLEDISIGSDGKITGRYSNGRQRVLAQIPVATFRNPAGLEKIGDNLFVTTPNSGQFDGIGSYGDVMGGVLEMSNVDLSAEFTDMITTQRGFQANSRIITVSDDMLQELVNLKR